MSIRVAINGYGRIGRNILRAHYESSKSHDLAIVAVNDLGPPETNAHLTRYDTAHGKFPGKVELDLPGGNYSYEIERGPEYLCSAGSFTLSGERRRSIKVTLSRLADLAGEGWWSGDMHVHRPVKDIELLMQAEDLHIAPVMTWWNNQNQWARQPLPVQRLVQFDRDRFYHVMAGEDEREGGALLYFNLPHPLLITGAGREHPSPMTFLAEARRQKNVWIDFHVFDGNERLVHSETLALTYREPGGGDGDLFVFEGRVFKGTGGVPKAEWPRPDAHSP